MVFGVPFHFLMLREDGGSER